MLLLAAMALCALPVESAADRPEVKLSFKNETEQSVRIALVYTTVKGETRKWGWSFIEPGRSKTIILPKSVSPESAMEATGYYAESIPQSGETKIIWRGEEREINVRDGDFNDAADVEYKNGSMVLFRKVNLKLSQGGNALGTITLKP